jgi:hypothetical protein
MFILLVNNLILVNISTYATIRIFILIILNYQFKKPKVDFIFIINLQIWPLK